MHMATFIQGEKYIIGNRESGMGQQYLRAYDQFEPAFGCTCTVRSSKDAKTDEMRYWVDVEVNIDSTPHDWCGRVWGVPASLLMPILSISMEEIW